MIYHLYFMLIVVVLMGLAIIYQLIDTKSVQIKNNNMLRGINEKLMLIIEGFKESDKLKLDLASIEDFGATVDDVTKYLTGEYTDDEYLQIIEENERVLEDMWSFVITSHNDEVD